MRFGLCAVVELPFDDDIAEKLMKNGRDGNDKTWKFAQNVVTLMDGKIFWCLIMSRVRETFASAFLDTIHSLLRLIEFPYPSLCVLLLLLLLPSSQPSLNHHDTNVYTHMFHLSLGSSVKLSICYLWCLSLDFLSFWWYIFSLNTSPPSNHQHRYVYWWNFFFFPFFFVTTWMKQCFVCICDCVMME